MPSHKSKKIQVRIEAQTKRMLAILYKEILDGVYQELLYRIKLKKCFLTSTLLSMNCGANGAGSINKSLYL